MGRILWRIKDIKNNNIETINPKEGEKFKNILKNKKSHDVSVKPNTIPVPIKLRESQIFGAKRETISKPNHDEDKQINIQIITND